MGLTHFPNGVSTPLLVGPNASIVVPNGSYPRLRHRPAVVAVEGRRRADGGFAPRIPLRAVPHPGGCLNDYLLSVLLGIVEGLTEFLPVSSTAHLRIAEALMKLPLDDAYWKMYTIVIQLGAILALCCCFWGALSSFCAPFRRAKTVTRTWPNHPVSLTLIAFGFTSVPSLLLHKWSEAHLGSIAGDGRGAADWRLGDVDHRCLERPPGCGHQGCGRDEPGSGDLDRHLPDTFGGLPRHFAVNV